MGRRIRQHLRLCCSNGPTWLWLTCLGLCAQFVCLAAGQGMHAPAPYGPLPSPRQLRWMELEFYGFVHFTVNTFTDKEWGYGDEPESVFNPSDFDADQIAAAAEAAGMKGLVLTCKHHDGFCLWPSKFTEHSVKNSPWRGGRGDVVRDLAVACRKRGLKFGVYLSPWDRNRADYGQASYLTYYRNQLRELLTNYGDVFIVWFDGANGGDGFYGGARELRHIDNRHYYDWENTWRLVRELQPAAVMFSDVGPDVRWVGNEQGRAGATCWATLNPEGAPGNTSANLNQGDRPGTAWIPAEDDKVKTPAQLLAIYYESVGRGACLNLNVPPDRRGQIHPNDLQSLQEFRRVLDATFAHNLAQDAEVTASNTRGGTEEFAPVSVVRRNGGYWTTDDQVTTPQLVVAFGRPTTFNVVSLREHLPLGQRVEAFGLDQWRNGQWQEFATGTSIGHRRLVRTTPVTTEKLRLRIVRAAVCPAIAELGVFLEPQAP